MRTRYVLGVDLGQVNDHTRWLSSRRVGNEFHARHIERLPLGMNYPSQVDHIVGLVENPELGGDVQVAADATGVGRAVTDLLACNLPREVRLTSVVITGGADASRKSSAWTVPKRELIGEAQVALQMKQLRIAADLPTAQLLIDELMAYSVKISETGHDSYGNGRDAPNDDLVLATAIALYVQIPCVPTATYGQCSGRPQATKNSNRTRSSNRYCVLMAPSGSDAVGSEKAVGGPATPPESRAAGRRRRSVSEVAQDVPKGHDDRRHARPDMSSGPAGNLPIHSSLSYGESAEPTTTVPNRVARGGPRTAEGKKAVSQNAVTHGINAFNPTAGGESVDEWNTFFDGIQEALRPSAP